MATHREQQVEGMTQSERRPYDDLASRNTVRFDELEVDWQSYPDTELADFERGLRLVFGERSEKVASDGAAVDGAAVDEHDFTVAIIEAEPGKGAALHAHTTEEVFLPLKGRWNIYWSPDENDIPQREATLGEWDAISIPGPVMRGFRNVSDDTGFLLIITGTTTPVIHHPSILARVAKQR